MNLGNVNITRYFNSYQFETVFIIMEEKLKIKNVD